MSRIVESLYQKYGLNEDITLWNAMNPTLDDKVKDVVCAQNSGDQLCRQIDSNITFRDILNALNNDEDVYDVIGVDDSIIREYVFSALTDALHCDYDDVYMRWLGKGPKIEECYDTSKQNLTEASREDVKQLLHKFKSDFVEILKYVGTPKLVGYRNLLDKMINEIAMQNGITESIHSELEESKQKLNEAKYSDPLFERIENALYDAGLDVQRFSDAMIMSNNLGWVVSDEDGESVQLECNGTW